MEATGPSTSKANKAQAILDHAAQLVHWATNFTSVRATDFPDPDLCFHSLPIGRKYVSPTERVALHDVGVQLWNACCALSRDVEQPDTRIQLAKARAFAYFVLESASSATDRSSLTNRAARNAARAARECLGTATATHIGTVTNDRQAYELIDLASRIIEHLAEHQAHPEDDRVPGATPDDEQYRLKADFLLLRIALAWKQQRLDLADHFHAALKNISTGPKKSWAWSAADLYSEIGASSLRIAQPDVAAVWLRRAEDVLEEMDTDISQVDPAELSLNIAHTLVRALLATNDPEAGQEALEKFTTLKQDYGHKLPVMLLEIELLSKDPEPHPDAYFAALSKIMRNVHIIEANHRLIMHNLHRLKTVSLTHALRALKNYIVQRLAVEDDRDHIESAVVTLIWMALSAPDSTEAGSSLCRDLEDIHTAWKQGLGVEAAHAATLRINKLTGPNGVEAVHWCQVGLHQLLASIGEHNVAKLQRKLIHCHINAGNFQAANEILVQLSEAERKNPLSNYLGYVIALRTQDASAADAAIGSVINDSRNDHQLLLACIGETMKHGSQRRGALLLQRMLDKFNYEPPSEIDACALLRCTARGHMSVLSEDAADDLEIMLMLCSVFRAAAAHTIKANGDESASASRECSIEECRWFEKTSFNIAFQHAEKWPAKAVVDLLAYSSMIVYPQQTSDELKSEKVRHTVNTKFLQAVVLAMQARSWSRSSTIEDIPRTSYHARAPPDATRLQCHLYQNVIERYFELYSALTRGSDDLPQTDDAEADLASKTATLLPLAFEAQLFTTLTDTALSGVPIAELSLTKLIDAIPSLTSSSKPYALLADLILSSASPDPAPGPGTVVQMPTRLPVQNATALLGRLITAMRTQEDYDVAKAARWIRCVVQLVLESRQDPAAGGGDDEESFLALLDPIIGEATHLARSSSSPSAAAAAKPTPAPSHDDAPRERAALYPADELQWLSTVLFNLAVDLYVAGKGAAEAAASWAAKAVAVADALAQMALEDGGDGGRLARVLRENGGRVGWTL